MHFVDRTYALRHRSNYVIKSRKIFSTRCKRGLPWILKFASDDGPGYIFSHANMQTVTELHISEPLMYAHTQENQNFLMCRKLYYVVKSICCFSIAENRIARLESQLINFRAICGFVSISGKWEVSDATMSKCYPNV